MEIRFWDSKNSKKIDWFLDVFCYFNRLLTSVFTSYRSDYREIFRDKYLVNNNKLGYRYMFYLNNITIGKTIKICTYKQKKAKNKILFFSSKLKMIQNLELLSRNQSTL